MSFKSISLNIMMALVVSIATGFVTFHFVGLSLENAIYGAVAIAVALSAGVFWVYWAMRKNVDALIKGTVLNVILALVGLCSVVALSSVLLFVSSLTQQQIISGFSYLAMGMFILFVLFYDGVRLMKSLGAGQ